MHRRSFLQSAAGAASSAALGGLSCGGEDRPPNVVVCFTDQFRAFETGCYGHPVVDTPHIDRLAETGFRFEVGVTNSPVCSPARANLLSGQYARTAAGSIENVGSIGTERTRFPDPTMPELFRDVGYETAHIGKWHVHVDPFLARFRLRVLPSRDPPPLLRPRHARGPPRRRPTVDRDGRRTGRRRLHAASRERQDAALYSQ